MCVSEQFIKVGVNMIQLVIHVCVSVMYVACMVYAFVDSAEDTQRNVQNV